MSAPTPAPDRPAPAVTRITPTNRVPARFYLRELWRRKGLVRVLSARELKKTYEMNIVGFAWWLLEPLTLTLVYVIVVDLIFQSGEPNYPLFIVIGVLPWKWLSSTMVGSMGVVRGNASLITDVYFPRALLPVVEVTVGLAHFLIGLMIIPIFMGVFGVGPSLALLWIPVIVAVQFLMILGISYPLSVWGLSYRNLPSVANNIIRLWFYLTPVIWSLDRIADKPGFLLAEKLNPATGILTSYRSVILDHRAPDWTLAYSAAIGLVLCAIGGLYFVRRESRFGKLI